MLAKFLKVRYNDNILALRDYHFSESHHMLYLATEQLALTPMCEELRVR